MTTSLSRSSTSFVTQMPRFCGPTKSFKNYASSRLKESEARNGSCTHRSSHHDSSGLSRLCRSKAATQPAEFRQISVKNNNDCPADKKIRIDGVRSIKTKNLTKSLPETQENGFPLATTQNITQPKHGNSLVETQPNVTSMRNTTKVSPSYPKVLQEVLIENFEVKSTQNNRYSTAGHIRTTKTQNKEHLLFEKNTRKIPISSENMNTCYSLMQSRFDILEQKLENCTKLFNQILSNQFTSQSLEKKLDNCIELFNQIFKNSNPNQSSSAHLSTVENSVAAYDNTKIDSLFGSSQQEESTEISLTTYDKSRVSWPIELLKRCTSQLNSNNLSSTTACSVATQGSSKFDSFFEKKEQKEPEANTLKEHENTTVDSLFENKEQEEPAANTVKEHDNTTVDSLFGKRQQEPTANSVTTYDNYNDTLVETNQEEEKFCRNGLSLLSTVTRLGCTPIKQTPFQGFFKELCGEDTTISQRQEFMTPQIKFDNTDISTLEYSSST